MSEKKLMINELNCVTLGRKNIEFLNHLTPEKHDTKKKYDYIRRTSIYFYTYTDVNGLQTRCSLWMSTQKL